MPATMVKKIKKKLTAEGGKTGWLVGFDADGQAAMYVHRHGETEDHALCGPIVMCCEKCKAKVEAGAAPFKAKLEEASKAAQLANYPLKTCAISGEPLGSMGAPVQLMLEGTLVQLCCKSCTKKAMAKPAEMAKKVTDAAYEAQKAQVNETCPVGGEAIADDKVDVMFGTRLVRFCCAKCVAKFEQEPAKYLPNLVQHAPGKEQEADEKKADKPKDGEHKGHG